MARPRAASDEQIIEAADHLAAEKGWRTVYAKAVHEHMNVGGSLSTFTKVISAWRATKQEEEGDVEAPANEVVEDRASIIDEGLTSIAGALKAMRTAVTDEIDRAVADERKKSDRIRADERDLHEKQIAQLTATIDAISAENDGLATEAQEESTRADNAEDELQRVTARTEDQAGEIQRLAQKIKDDNATREALKSEIEALQKSALDLQAVSDAAVKKAEDRADQAWSRMDALEQRLAPVIDLPRPKDKP
ncbi:hypothetical protein [Oceaniglobus ichthyenteri]|uniref:hypothetical protein n=1 Tax=Oceaniglobus ichthyenteri TaxID=2136177 RepID=UPI000F823169|nr:hypothetical protein [Oceaniglobus ichthyenteri]